MIFCFILSVPFFRRPLRPAGWLQGVYYSFNSSGRLKSMRRGLVCGRAFWL
ncbi:hypothetical protein NEIELOOT_00453 [Neisseria elongata subsp. glycolytica ATCC 29315]|uniref:Uncharacterized protein n=1 Tax=Neisseria elongata subsp. glycolytica ATCC 29315 TaxID=546263 RepID=D4DN28_NEIEG|nr:hypothetical protein NEIELOOT_00453 [Neisseria elongata subsp. glycolytica ATCC 29315]